MKDLRRESKVAKLLLESLPYLREFYGETIVIKYGGHAMKDEELKNAFAKCVILLRYIGLNPVIVHGGGPQIGQMLERLGINCTFREGLRVTDEATMNVVEMVLAGTVNKQIVNLVNQNGGRAVGLSGKDGRTIRCRKLEIAVTPEDPTMAPEIIDIGQVGEVVEINPVLIRTLEREGFIPIIAPVGVDDEGRTYNINADSVAAAVAGALGARRLILLTDVAGVLGKDGELISSLSVRDAVRAIEDGTARGGMIPKLKCCLEALDAGVEKAQIIDGRIENSLILELFTREGIGTQIVRQP
ncbi:acetylglutamate kinase [Desulfocurvus sp.]|uniref:acetylglutamate kinase n=1 Tax=Desulfocurvus sp. TaxID=2871698 RepID=UPI0025C05D42|nr:acetylglutamate kinase [Desulfocurvus sp.]MCK9241365.1 acetylglutamate kinase [Desulfocurvus sp.]